MGLDYACDERWDEAAKTLSFSSGLPRSYLTYRKLDPLKQFLSLLAFAISFSALAQLPYNPDSNNDGHIGAVDLTSLLSVYSNNFSNGVIGEGTSILEPYIQNYDPENSEEPQYPSAYFFWDGSTSFVIDFSFVSESVTPWGDYWTFWVDRNDQEWINGTTMTAIIPYGSYNDILVDSGEHSLGVNGTNLHRFIKWVYWNGYWHRNW